MSFAAFTKNTVHRAVFIGALGYFVDIFDIQLFAVLRTVSLTDIGVPSEHLAAIGGNILNAQMLGMILGAFLWGWLGDRFGRYKALYGSILVYSLGTFACAFVQDPITYGLMRFVTGFGLAGETGAAITLVSELMSPRKRALGITIVGAVAFMGPVAAVLISWIAPWRETYIITGLLGLALFILRIGLLEPSMFEKMRNHNSQRGSLKLLAEGQKVKLFFLCLMVGLPLIFSWQFMLFFAGEIGKSILPAGAAFEPKFCLLAFYIGTACGDISGGLLSQAWQSRRKPLFLYFFIGLIVTAFYLVAGPHLGLSPSSIYILYWVLGVSAGSWILFAMFAAEQFGTNIRATTAITITNLVRGFTIPIILAYQALQLSIGITLTAAMIGAVLYAIGFYALTRMPDTHGTDLDFIEQRK